VRKPRLTVNALCSTAVLDPNGAHVMEIDGPAHLIEGVRVPFSLLDELESQIAEFRAHVAVADGGPDFIHPKRIPLGTGR